MSLFNFFLSTKKEETLASVQVDMHSHLLPGIDDGSPDFEESLKIIKELSSLGYRKLITTPHIMGDFFKNTPEIILSKLDELKQFLKANGVEIEIEAAAEYYLDEWFMEKLKSPQPLLTFGNNYLLFETSYINEPSHLTEAIFEMRTREYRPVLAHPERYTYMYSDFNKFKEIYDKGVLFQININSLSGYYSQAAQKFAIKLIENNMVDFIGTDCHGLKHIEVLKKTMQQKVYKKILRSKIINNTLL
jgi:protein-tyrosine phosphatase